MLPDTYDDIPGFRVSKTFLAVFAIALITIGMCFVVLLMMAVRNWAFRAECLLLPVFSACLIGTLTIFYSFIIQSRYIWNIAGILTALFGTLSTVFFGMFMIFAYRCAALDSQMIYRHQSAIKHRNHTSYEAYQPKGPSPTLFPIVQNETNESIYLNPFSHPLEPIASPPALAGGGTWSGSHRYTDSASVLSERPSMPSLNQQPSAASLDQSQPNGLTLTEDELTRQQMLMLLTNKSDDLATSNSSGRQRAESGYRIDWENEEDVHSPAVELASGDRFASVHNQAIKKKLMDAAAAGKLPPDYMEKEWDGVWRNSTDILKAQHPAFRESRFVKTGGDREARRKEIERMGTRTYRGSN